MKSGFSHNKYKRASTTDFQDTRTRRKCKRSGAMFECLLIVTIQGLSVEIVIKRSPVPSSAGSLIITIDAAVLVAHLCFLPIYGCLYAGLLNQSRRIFTIAKRHNSRVTTRNTIFSPLLLGSAMCQASSRAAIKTELHSSTTCTQLDVHCG